MATVDTSGFYIPEVVAANADAAFVNSMQAWNDLRFLQTLPVPVSGNAIVLPRDIAVSQSAFSDRTLDAAVNTKVTPNRLTGTSDVAPVVRMSYHSFLKESDWLQPGRSQAEMSAAFGATIGRASAVKAKVLAFKAVIAALRRQAALDTTNPHLLDVYSTGATSEGLTIKRLLQLSSKLGDAAPRASLLVAHSVPLGDQDWDMINTYSTVNATSEAIAGTMPPSINVVRSNKLGKDIVADDDLPTIDQSGTRVEYQSILCGEGLVRVGYAGTSPIRITPFAIYDEAEIQNRIRCDFDIAIQVKGMSYSGATASVTEAGLYTASNWALGYADHRELVGALITTASGLLNA